MNMTQVYNQDARIYAKDYVHKCIEFENRIANSDYVMQELALHVCVHKTSKP